MSKVTKFEIGDKVYCDFNKGYYILLSRYDVVNNKKQTVSLWAYNFEDPTLPHLVLRDFELTISST